MSIIYIYLDGTSALSKDRQSLGAVSVYVGPHRLVLIKLVLVAPNPTHRFPKQGSKSQRFQAGKGCLGLVMGLGRVDARTLT